MSFSNILKKLFKNEGAGPEVKDTNVSKYISIQDWSSTYDYPIATVVRGSDGVLYSSVAQSGPNAGGAQDPTADDGTYWTAMSTDDTVIVHKTGNETIAGKKTFTEYNYQVNNNPAYIMVVGGIASDGSLVNEHATSGLDWFDKDRSKAWAIIKYSYYATSHELWFALRSRYDNSIINSLHFINFQGNGDFLFYPEDDGKTYLGASGHRWKTVFASTGTINTSDKRLKSLISEIPDNVLDAWSNVSFVKYKFKDAIEQKGESARFHSGLVAQQIDEAFQSRGIDAREYGLFCYDQWEAEPEQVDETGNVVHHAMPAGDRYSLRYDEALCLEAAYQRRRADRAEVRIAALEEKLAAIESKLG